MPVTNTSKRVYAWGKYPCLQITYLGVFVGDISREGSGHGVSMP